MEATKADAIAALEESRMGVENFKNTERFDLRGV